MAKRKRRSSSTAKRVSVKTSNGSDMTCGFDSRGFAWLFFILGVLYLFSDLGWIVWWNINWWTIIFLLIGIKMLKK